MCQSRRVVAVGCEGAEGLGGDVCSHFGHTPYFAVAEIAGSDIVVTGLVASPGHGDGACSMPDFIRKLGAQTLITGGLGARAAQMLEGLGIEVMGGISGNAGDALRALAAGTLTKGDSTCSGHGPDGSGCGGHTHEHKV